MVCPCVLCCAVLLRGVLPGVALLCAVLFGLLRLVLPRAVLCPGALSVVLGSCAFWRSVLSCPPALCVFAVVCRCVVLFAVVLCAVCALGCRVVRFLLYLLEKPLQNFVEYFFSSFFSAFQNKIKLYMTKHTRVQQDHVRCSVLRATRRS